MEQLHSRDISKIYSIIDSCTSFEHISSCYDWMIRLRDKIDSNRYMEIQDKLTTKKQILMDKYIYSYLH